MTNKSAGVTPIWESTAAQMAVVNFTGDSSSTPVPVNVGFTPMYAILFDTTNTKRYEWAAGMAATDSFYLVTGADPSIDTNSAIQTNFTTGSQTEPGDYAVNASGAGVPSLINTTVTVPYQNRTLTYICQLGINVNSAVYVLVMFG